MSAEPSGESHPIAWTALVMLGVPLLYLLSVPPIWYLDLKTHKPVPGSLYLGSAKTLTYCGPYMDLRNNTPLQGPLNAYLHWWWEQFFPSSPIKR
jgi:hypothetical protein